MENKYYIYAHINPLKNEIFYIGKGKGKRAYIKSKRSKFWKDTVKKYGYIVDILEDGLSNEEAYEREKFYIAKIGRRDLGTGTLVNLTDGGDGQNNYSEETRYKMGHMRGKTHSEETIKKMSEAHKGRETTQEHRDNLSKANTGFKHSKETKEKMKITNQNNNRKYYSEEDRLNARRESLKKYRLKLKNNKLNNNNN